jgi:hypothetical protein
VVLGPVQIGVNTLHPRQRARRGHESDSSSDGPFGLDQRATTMAGSGMLAGIAGVATFLVAVRGIEPRSRG